MAYCLRHAGPQMAEDVVAETFAVVWRKRDQIPDPPLPWLIVVAKNNLSAMRRKHQRQDDVAHRLRPLTELAAASPEMGVEHRAEILAALDQLNEDDREALLLIAWDGLQVREAARVLGTTPGALRVRILRARACLRKNSLEGATHA